MKIFLSLIAFSLISGSGVAAEYTCKGVDRADRDKKVTLELKRVTAKKAIFVDQDGDEHELDRNLRSNENKYKYAVFADYGYDGYGGFLKLSIPKSLLRRPSVGPLVIYYLQHLYSEAGHVGTVDIRAVCRR